VETLEVKQEMEILVEKHTCPETLTRSHIHNYFGSHGQFTLQCDVTGHFETTSF